MKKINYLIFSALILNLILPTAVSAIGMVSETISIDNALRGQEFVRLLSLSNSDESDAAYGLQAEGAIKDWTSFYDINDEMMKDSINEIVVPAKEYLDVKVKFAIPAEVPNGQYSGKVMLFNLPKENETNDQTQVGVRLKVTRDVDITVVDQEIIDVETSIIPIKYKVSKEKPLQLKIIYSNLGNITAKPDVQLRIKKANNEIFNAIFPYPESQQPIKPGERKEMPFIEWQTLGQDSGYYDVYVVVRNKEQIIGEDDFLFIIGDNANDNFLAAVAKIGGGNMTLGWIFAGFLLVAGAAALIALYKNPKLIKVGISKFRSLF